MFAPSAMLCPVKHVTAVVLSKATFSGGLTGPAREMAMSARCRLRELRFIEDIPTAPACLP
jgi:hypothetical protein